MSGAGRCGKRGWGFFLLLALYVLYIGSGQTWLGQMGGVHSVDGCMMGLDNRWWHRASMGVDDELNYTFSFFCYKWIPYLPYLPTYYLGAFGGDESA